MSRSKAAERIAALREELQKHDYLYYVQHEPVISDEAYDRLLNELRGLEAEHPELVTPDSPTQRVGERPLEGFEHVRHRVPMLSIDNTYSPDELREFDARVRKRLDIAAPLSGAWELAKAWPESELMVVAGAGHDQRDPGMAQCIVAATDRFRE